MTSKPESTAQILARMRTHITRGKNIVFDTPLALVVETFTRLDQLQILAIEALNREQLEQSVARLKGDSE